MAQEILKTFDKFGHSVGSHGGWIHDYSGFNITDTNQLPSSGGACVNRVTQVDNFEQCYLMHHQAVDGTIGKPSRSYSAPVGNNPPWAMNWLEERGVVSRLLCRTHRPGRDAALPRWEAVQSEKVGVSRDTFGKAGKLNWYTLERLADFMTTRLDVKWSQLTDANGVTRFEASHPTSLVEMAWRLPKSKYVIAPRVVSGSATVEAHDAAYWLVKAGPGRRLAFTAKTTPS